MSQNKQRLFIKNIEFQNFGPFFGKFDFPFSNDPKKSITTIVADSNVGKTTFHDITHWGLYGEVKKPITIDYVANVGLDNIEDQGVMHTEAYRQLSKDQSCTTSVIIELHDSEGIKFQIKRELTATLSRETSKKKFDGLNNSRVPDGLDFEMKSFLSYRKGGKMEGTSDPNNIEIYLGDAFPFILRDHFLFDGELLDEFASAKPSDLIQDGIEKITGLHIMDNLSKNTGDFWKNKQDEIGATQIKSKPIQALKKVVNNRLEVNQGELEKKEEELHKQDLRYDAIVGILDRTKTAKTMKSSFKQLEDNKKGFQKENNINSNDFKNFLFEKTPELLLKSTLEEFEKICARLEEDDKFPPAFGRHAVEKILNSDPLKCVCGREFEKNNDPKSPFAILNGLLTLTTSDSITKGVPVGRDLMGGVLNSLGHTEISTKFKQFKTRRHDFEEKISSITVDMKKQDDLIKQTGNKDNTELTDEKGDLSSSRRKLEGEILELKEKIEEDEKEKRSLQRKLDNAIEKDDQYATELKEISIAKALSKLVSERRGILKDDFRTRTEETASKYFLASAPGKQAFHQEHPLKITSNYNVLGVSKEGDNKKLSRGQSHTLGLSFIGAMRDITNINTFLMIDSPLHNISGTFRREICEVLCEYLPEIQLTLLMTDTEYLYGDDKNKPVQDIFRRSGRLWKEFEIKESVTAEGITTRTIEEIK